MSIHPSLSSSKQGKSQRTVLKRVERIKHLMEKDKWSEESKVFGLPKIKMLKLKVVKKEKAEKPEEEAAAAATAETGEAKTDAKAKATPAAKEKK